MRLYEIFSLLFDKYGTQNWWPGDTPWEIATGALLTQNTNWGNVEKAIVNLKRLNLLDPAKIADSRIEVIQDAIRPAGYFRLKTGRFKNLARWWLENVRNDRLRDKSSDLDFWRNSLLSVNGVGRETADSILLYSFNLPTFVIDAYTKRIMSRHYGTAEFIDYEELRCMFMEELPRDSVLFNEFHALFVRLGKEACGKRGCTEECLLRRVLPAIQFQIRPRQIATRAISMHQES